MRYESSNVITPIGYKFFISKNQLLIKAALLGGLLSLTGKALDLFNKKTLLFSGRSVFLLLDYFCCFCLGFGGLFCGCC